MTGLKSGSGDDLWGDDEATDEANEDGDEGAESKPSESAPGDADLSTDPDSGTDDSSSPTGDSGSGTRGDRDSEAGGSSGAEHPYIVRRAVQDKSVQFERDERLTFFVHDDVTDGERDLITDVESALGRDVPKFDVREAVYRAALRNPDDVLDELLEMGYSLDDET